MARKILGQQVPLFFNQSVSHLYTRLSTGPLRMPRSGSPENALPMEEEKTDEGVTLGRRQRASAPPADDEAHETDILSMDNASKRTKTAWEPAELWQLCRAYLCSLPLDQDVLGTVPNTSVGWNSLMDRFVEMSPGTSRNTLAIRQLLTRKITGGTVRPRTLAVNFLLECASGVFGSSVAPSLMDCEWSVEHDELLLLARLRSLDETCSNAGRIDAELLAELGTVCRITGRAPDAVLRRWCTLLCFDADVPPVVGLCAKLRALRTTSPEAVPTPEAAEDAGPAPAEIGSSAPQVRSALRGFPWSVQQSGGAVTSYCVLDRTAHKPHVVRACSTWSESAYFAVFSVATCVRVRVSRLLCTSLLTTGRSV